MIKLEHIAKHFKGKTVLKDVNLNLRKGSLVCLTGPSGIGKTTVLDVAAGIVKPDSGFRCIRSEKIGYAFQEPRLIPWLTALENLNFILSAQKPDAARNKKARFWLGKFGLTEAAHKKPFEMSGGMRRRLCLAGSLVTNPEILFIDEPFAFLDEKWQQIVVEQLTQLNINFRLTILMVSHQQEPIEKMRAELIQLRRSPLVINCK